MDSYPDHHRFSATPGTHPSMDISYDFSTLTVLLQKDMDTNHTLPEPSGVRSYEDACGNNVFLKTSQQFSLTPSVFHRSCHEPLHPEIYLHLYPVKSMTNHHYVERLPNLWNLFPNPSPKLSPCQTDFL